MDTTEHAANTKWTIETVSVEEYGFSLSLFNPGSGLHAATYTSRMAETDTAPRIDPRPSHQTIEEAFRPARDMLARLPEQPIIRKRAVANLDAAENYAHELRDKMRPPLEDD